MKSLKESILGSTNTGKQKILKDKIEEWCDEQNIYYGGYTINSKYEIEPNISSALLNLYSEDYGYDELPEYINFASNKELAVQIGEIGAKLNIKSFRGLPEKCRSIHIQGRTDKLPYLKIDTKNLALAVKAKTIEGIECPNCEVLFVYNFNTNNFKQMKLTGLKEIILRMGNVSSEFEKKVASLAQSNYHPEYYNILDRYLKHPIDEKCEKELYKFFGNIDLSNVERIDCAGKEEFIQYKGKWYKITNDKNIK
jgi:hypothetical protein